MTVEEPTKAASSQKKTIVGIVRAYLTKHYEEDTYHEATFEGVKDLVMQEFPESRFCPTHFSYYKSQFLSNIGKPVMVKARVRRAS